MFYNPASSPVTPRFSNGGPLGSASFSLYFTCVLICMGLLEQIQCNSLQFPRADLYALPSLECLLPDSGYFLKILLFVLAYISIKMQWAPVREAEL